MWTDRNVQDLYMAGLLALSRWASTEYMWVMFIFSRFCYEYVSEWCGCWTAWCGKKFCCCVDDDARRKGSFLIFKLSLWQPCWSNASSLIQKCELAYSFANNNLLLVCRICRVNNAFSKRAFLCNHKKLQTHYLGRNYSVNYFENLRKEKNFKSRTFKHHFGELEGYIASI